MRILLPHAAWCNGRWLRDLTQNKRTAIVRRPYVDLDLTLTPGVT